MGNSIQDRNVDFQIRTVFLLGQIEDNEIQDQIVAENRIHNDLIQESFLDTYNNLTLKTVMMLKWINNNCAGKGESFTCLEKLWKMEENKWYS